MKDLGRYRYVGPAELAGTDPPVGAVVVGSRAVLDRRPAGSDPDEPVTFVVALDGSLRIAPRRSEHVALAGGGDVLAAGEMTFAREGGRWTVAEVTNQSTGYCPGPGCWTAVRRALDHLGLDHPGAFTTEIVFRRCPSCGERNIVRDGDFTCALCDSALPLTWNFPPA
ncbi:hypothetical protein [Actinoplanes philippinensis]|uniref:hypothetical protein n=1 Tax=Actinoplanes philippinensis TaxID=35752 RepID=UPI0033FDFF9E